jgi:hypothetical protein
MLGEVSSKYLVSDNLLTEPQYDKGPVEMYTIVTRREMGEGHAFLNISVRGKGHAICNQ